MPNEQPLPTPFLLCRSRQRLCAFPLQHVRETMRALPLDTVPNMPPFMLGVCLIRGQVVPVVDLACLTGAGVGFGAHGARYITLDLQARRVALAVDEVIGVRSLADAALAGVPPLLDGAAGAGILSDLTTLDAELLLVLQATRLVPDALWPLLAAPEAAA